MAKKIFSNSGRFFLSEIDVTSERAIERFISSVYQKTKRIDILINNAGYSHRPMRVENLSVGEFRKNLSANLLSTFLLCKRVIPIFRRQKKGSIINISSMAGKRAVPYLAAYSASKFGVVALSQSVAKENQNVGLRCITVCPGGMNTPMRAKLFGLRDAQRQQSTDFVANVIMKIIQKKILVKSGGDIIIRHGKITAINPPLPA